MQIVLATHNAHKYTELQQLLVGSGIELRSLAQFTDHSPEESGLSFVENALLKARYATRSSGLPAIADDSGLVVDALAGAPGIHSARYAGARATDQDNVAKLLDALREVPPQQRIARYHCALVFLRFEHDPAPLVYHGTWEGRILQTARGSGGFGYDPVFEVIELGLSAAELSGLQKNRLSHRGKALAQLLAGLRAELGGQS